MVYHYSCPVCNSRVLTCPGQHVPTSILCPNCDAVLIVLYQYKDLFGKITDSTSPKDLVESLNECNNTSPDADLSE